MVSSSGWDAIISKSLGFFPFSNNQSFKSQLCQFLFIALNVCEDFKSLKLWPSTKEKLRRNTVLVVLDQAHHYYVMKLIA